MSDFNQLKMADAIYVFCPGGTQTGGPELLHQLVHTLRQIGKEAYIAYYPLDKAWETPAAYQRYQCPQATTIPDARNIVVIAPEVMPQLLNSFNTAIRVIWWLSVDNYRGNFDTWVHFKKWAKKSLVDGFKFRPEILHVCQSEYARQFIRRRFQVEGQMLSDFLAEEYWQESPNTVAGRRNMVVYNPLKGARFTQKVKAALPDVQWLALENMTRAQVREALESAKVYIDFGTHPGKDRIPREAAMSGCVVIVGLRGSARFEADIAIAGDYKYEVGRQSVAAIAERIRQVMGDYDRHYQAQRGYRQSIQAEPELFKQQVASLFGS